jgi:hypothetical protein
MNIRAWFVIVPVVDPLVLNLNGVVFLASHLMWGAALGLLWPRFGTTDERYTLRPA